MLTRGITSSHPRNAVFNTAELLENILLAVSPKDVVAARRVNHHWNALIITSTHLQRKLFLLPVKVQPLWTFDNNFAVFRKGPSGDEVPASEDCAILAPGILNSLLFKINSPEQKGSLAQRATMCETMRLLARPDLTKLDSIHHSMMVCMPPTDAVEFMFFYHKERRPFRSVHGESLVRARVENKNGVRFGDVIHSFLAEVGPGMPGLPSDGYAIDVRRSKLWILGVVFPTEQEKATIENGSA